MKNYYFQMLVLFRHLIVPFYSRRSAPFLIHQLKLCLMVTILGTSSFLWANNTSNVNSAKGKVTAAAMTVGQDFYRLLNLKIEDAFLDCHECLTNINLSLDLNCERLITADLLLQNPTLPLSNYQVRLTVGNGLVISDKTLRAQHVGKVITAMVTYLGPGPCPQGVACMTNITLHSEIEVTITPNPARTVYCFDPFLKLDPSSSEYEDVPTAVQTCGGAFNGPFFGGDWVTIHDCVLGEQDTAKTILRQWWAISKDGTRSMAFDTIYVLRLPPISADNFYCQDKDTLYCGISDTPVGPYMIVPNPMSMSDCDTIYFLDPDLQSNMIDPQCGFSVKIDSLVYENTGCVGLKKITVQVHQNCYGVPANTVCQLPTGSSEFQLEGGLGQPIYATCEFWLTDLDTMPPYISCNLDGIIELDTICEDGFTLSHGYWKTHSIFGPAPYDDTWALLPSGENTAFFLSNQTYYEVINDVPAGNAYYILAFQYIAAKLNFLNGSDPSSVQAVFDQATMLFTQYTPQQIGTLMGNNPIRSQFVMLGMILDDYNTGMIGPGFCQAGLELPATTVEAGPDCIATFQLQKVMAMDVCHDVKLVKAMVESFGFVIYEYDSTTGYWISDENVSLPLRPEPYLVILEAIDECYNVGRDTCAVVVIDATNPTAVAHSGLTLELPAKVGFLEASQIDNYSTDNCGVNLVLARRSDWVDHWSQFCDTTEFIPLTGPDLDTIWCRTPNPLNGEVEKIYADAIAMFGLEARPCDLTMYQSWYYDLCKTVTVDCQGDLTETEFRELYAMIFPDTDVDQVSLIGGGWAEQVPFTCSDACDSVTVELLIMDFWCNWSTTWTKVYVEDKTPAQVVADVTDSITLSCIAYNQDSAFTLTGSNAPISLSEVFLAAGTGNVAAQALLDSVLGGYQKAWYDGSGYVDLNGDPIDTDITLIDSGICVCNDVILPVTYYDIVSQSFMTKDSLVQVCETISQAQLINQGIVAVNCIDNSYCDQDIIFDLDDCGLGTITRRFKIWKTCGNEIPDTITREQVITLVNHCELNKYMFDLPGDTIIDGCAPQFDPGGSGNVIGFADPEITGMPVFNFEADCRIAAVAHDDKVLTWLSQTGECYAVVRQWYLADWCVIGDQDPDWWMDQNLVVDSFTQIIVLLDTVAPACEIEIEGKVNDTLSIGTCPDGDILATFFTFDTCGTMQYNYSLDTMSNPPQPRAFGGTLLSGDVRDTMDVQILNVEPGRYRLIVTIEDHCGNVGECADTFVVTCDVSSQAVMQAHEVVQIKEKALDEHNQDKLDLNRNLPIGFQQEEFELYQNHPNPFRSSTTISFLLPESQSARLTIFDIQGRMLQTVEGFYNKGFHEIQFDAEALQVKGVLYYQLETNTHTATRRMIITP